MFIKQVNHEKTNAKEKFFRKKRRSFYPAGASSYCPNLMIVLAPGSRDGICMMPDGKKEVYGILKTTAADATAAGDTSARYFLRNFYTEVM